MSAENQLENTLKIKIMSTQKEIYQERSERMKMLHEEQELGNIEFEFIEPFKAIIKSKKAEVTYWIKSSIWATNGDPKLRKSSQGTKEVISYLKDPESYSFEIEIKQQVRKSKKERMDEGISLIKDMKLEYNILNGYLIRIMLENDYVDFWPTTEKWKINSGVLKYGQESLIVYLKMKSKSMLK